MIIEQPGTELATLLGQTLPEDALPSKHYPGETRLLVPTVRTCLAAGESFQLKVVLLGAEAEEASLYWKPLTGKSFRREQLTHIARGVYTVTLSPELVADDFEYYVQVSTGTNKTLVFPATAPLRNQTVVIMP